MRWILLTIAVSAACDGAGSHPDADPGIYECFPERGCEQGRALDVPFTEVPPEYVTPTVCEDRFSQPCAAGCAVESMDSGYDLGAMIDAAIFCAETPAAQVGDRCDLGCLPTRATVDGSGVVTLTYLACDPPSQLCVAASPPTVSMWMAPCPHTAMTWGKPGVNGRAGASYDDGDDCLLAWDGQTGTLASGTTPVCLGDWDCPAGAMCDDHVPRLDGTEPFTTAVCRPGARGTPIDPAALHP